MAKRDVDSVDPALPARPVPESIAAAERWRVLGMTLRSHNPELFARVFELIVVSRALGEPSEENIPESYFMT